MATVRAVAPTGATGRRPAVDRGRLVMVPLSVTLGCLALLRLLAVLRQGPGADGLVATAAEFSTALLVGTFYILIVKAYLRRSAAQATAAGPLRLVAGPVATCLPFALPFAGSGGAPEAVLLLGNLLLVAGFAFSVWSLRCLDRSLSVVPQARALVQHGPYARVRHPLYLGELVAVLGLALTLGGPGPVLLWLALAGLQAYRAVQEEGLLLRTLPEYAAYSRRTARIVPGLF